MLMLWNELGMIMETNRKLKIKGFSLHFESLNSVMGPHYIAGTYFPLVFLKMEHIIIMNNTLNRYFFKMHKNSMGTEFAYIK